MMIYRLRTIAIATAVALGSFFLTSCQPDVLDEDPEMSTTKIETAFDPSVIEQLKTIGVNTEDVEEFEFVYPDGSTESKYRIEKDIVVSRDELKELSQTMSGLRDQEKQYSTNALVSQGSTINVIGYTGGGGYGLSSRMRTALSWAINNYNRLNISLNFTLTYGTNYQPYDMVVYRVPNGQAGGSAGFPSGGDPYKWIQIYSGLDSYSTNVNEHVITHEIGHAVGFRHTDYFSRQSCGQNTNEGSAGVGANHVPGTPTGYDSNSIMLACFSSNEDGEFGSFDVVALEYLY
ncbi:MAG: M57 family metalloprotease [Bacteroidia bacterium]|nr:M57 family metalloprotease [Bacteroidia bacterium]